MDPEPPLERRFLGMVEVDSGTLLVGDPLYSLPHAERGRAGIDYDAVIRTSDPPATYLDGKPVLLLSQFGGDGTYPVFGEFDTGGEFLRATIEFVEPDDDEGVEAGD